MKRMGRRLGAVALLAMLVRAIVPSGFMLATAETPEGRFLTIEMCEGHGLAPRVVDLDTGKLIDPAKAPKAPAEGKVKAPPCVFAASAHVATPTPVAELVAFPVEHGVAFDASRDVRPGEGIPAPPPPSTGPPSLI